MRIQRQNEIAAMIEAHVEAGRTIPVAEVNEAEWIANYREGLRRATETLNEIMGRERIGMVM